MITLYFPYDSGLEVVFEVVLVLKLELVLVLVLVLEPYLVMNVSLKICYSAQVTASAMKLCVMEVGR